MVVERKGDVFSLFLKEAMAVSDLTIHGYLFLLDDITTAKLQLPTCL